MLNIPDLQGKVALVTGGNAGIGSSIVRLLAAHNPSRIYLCSRGLSSAEEWIQEVHKTHPSANITPLVLDLSSFSSVEQCAREVSSSSDRLDFLFLNAGISGTAPQLTDEGFEHQFGVNHMGHALLTQLLMPKMLLTQKNDPGADVRIIVTSSILAYQRKPRGGLVLSEMKSTAEEMGPLVRYGHSKLANILFARKLAQVYPSIVTTSHHPGVINSGIYSKASGLRLLTTLISPFLWLFGGSIDKGAETGLWCATVSKDQIKNGQYYEPVGVLTDKSKEARDQHLVDELWEWTNRELAEHAAPGWPEQQ